jgi:hypothetical protein
MKTIYLATAESRSFSFQAVGSTAKSAMEALRKGLLLHAKQYNIDPDWHVANADFGVEALTLGEVYRDGSHLKEVS